MEIKPREIEIYSIKLLEFYENIAKIEVFCKKGTYIRSLVNDIGLKLGCGAYMKELVRIKAGIFDIEDSDKLNSDNFRQILPQDALNLPRYEINDEEYEKIKNGNFIENNSNLNHEIVLLTKNNILVSLAKLSDNLIKPKKFFGEVI